MKRLILIINNLGDNSASVECVDFNIWQGKRLLISDRINGKWSGEFAKVYNIDYDQEHPEQLRLESNAPLTVSMIAHFEGVRYQPYYDVGGVLTVCVGHTGMRG